MIRTATFFLSIAITCLQLHAQKQERDIISGSFHNTPFTDFAAEVRICCGIDIFYLNEWVQNITITASGDSIDLEQTLRNHLDKSGIHFYRNHAGQYFLTGKERIDDLLLRTAGGASREISDTATRAQLQERQIKYAPAVRRVTIGTRENRQSGGFSVISGKISSSASGEPVPGASVTVDGTATGTSTNNEGFYALQLRPGETYNISVASLGMQRESYIVELYSSGTLNIELTDQLIDIQEVVVRSGRYDNVRGMQMGFQRIDIRTVRSIPVVMGERDIIKVAVMMPGVQTVGEGTSGFNVRGSTSDQNLFLINGIPVLNTGHLFGFFTSFNPDMVSDFNLYKSNFPAEYGGRLASVFEVTTRKGNKKKFGARGALSPVTGSLLLETPLIKDKGSFIIGGRSTYSDWILKRIDNPDIANSEASFYDIMSGVHFLTGKSGSVQLFGYHSDDRFTLATTNRYHYTNSGASLMFNRPLTENWKIDVAGIFGNYMNYHSKAELPAFSYDHRFTVSLYELKAKVTGFRWLNHTAVFGGGALFHHIDQGVVTPLGDESIISPIEFGKERALEFNIHASDEYAISDRLKIYGGLRYSLFSNLGPGEVYLYNEGTPRETQFINDTLHYGGGDFIKTYSGPEYRISLNYEVSPLLSVKAGYNKMRQYLFMLSNTIAMSPTDRWKLADPYIVPPVSDQLSAGLYRNIPGSALETSAEVYLKLTRHQMDYKDGAELTMNQRFETAILQGNQRSWGAEFLIKRNAGRLTGWLSYAYSRSVVHVAGDYDWDRINSGNPYPSNYDKPHAINLVSNYQFSRRIGISANIVYSTGRPITYPTALFTAGGQQIILYSDRNQYRIPDYFRIDISINYEGNLKKDKKAHGSWMLAIYNLTGRRNAYSVYFRNEGGRINGYKQSIYGVPLFTISYNFKLGNYAVD